MQGQHLMQQMNQNLMGGYASPTTVTTDLIQQYLDENKQLILAILDNQNSGKVEECARNQAKLQHNLMYLAAIADSQPPQASSLAQYPQSMMMQAGGPRYMQHQQSPQQQQQSQMLSQHHQPTTNPLLSARNPMLYSSSSQQPPLSPLHSSSLTGPSQGFSLLHGTAGDSASLGGGGFLYSDFGRGGNNGKEVEGKSEDGSGSGGGGGMYLKRNEDES
ncbi:hypothetical protein LUZ60_006708 [Juncus effusus]|nr:hypothetical protein LUZ60_006708 [Juncus effusus]